METNRVFPAHRKSVLRSLESLSASWGWHCPSIAKLISGQSGTEAFSRSAKRRRRLGMKVIESGRSAEALLSKPNATSQQKSQLAQALTELEADVAGVTATTVVDATGLQGAEAGVSKYLGALTAFGNSLPRDKAMMDELISASQRSIRSEPDQPGKAFPPTRPRIFRMLKKSGRHGQDRVFDRYLDRFGEGFAGCTGHQPNSRGSPGCSNYRSHPECPLVARASASRAQAAGNPRQHD